MSEILEALQCARALLSDQAHWCQESYAIDNCESPVEANSESAVAWCAVGAIGRCAPTHSASVACAELLTDVAAERYPCIRDITALNDGEMAYSYEEAYVQVLDVFDAAILAQAIKEGVAR